MTQISNTTLPEDPVDGGSDSPKSCLPGRRRPFLIRAAVSASRISSVRQRSPALLRARWKRMRLVPARWVTAYVDK